MLKYKAAGAEHLTASRLVHAGLWAAGQAMVGALTKIFREGIAYDILTRGSPAPASVHWKTNGQRILMASDVRTR